MEPNQAIVAASAAVQSFIKTHELPIEGVTILGGRVYINGVGLLVKAKKMGLKGIRVEIVKSATKEDLNAIVKATVEMMDGGIFEDFGYGSTDSIQMKTLHNADVITMTTITRAKNRALRNATGVGLVSAEEMKDASDMYSGEDAPKLALPAPETKTDAPTPEALGNLLDTLKILGKDADKMLRHFSGVWSRPLTKVEDLTAADVAAIMETLRPALAAKSIAPKGEPTPVESPVEPPAAPPAVEVEVMPSKPESAARKAMRKGMERGKAKKEAAV